MTTEIKADQFAGTTDPKDGSHSCSATLPNVVESDVTGTELYIEMAQEEGFKCIFESPDCSKCPVAANSLTAKDGYYNVPIADRVEGPTLAAKPLATYKARSKSYAEACTSPRLRSPTSFSG
jgi:hypothetical protein